MLENSNIKMIYSKIQKQLFYMIPEKWDSIYLYASITERINHLDSGELFFYYFPKSIFKKNPINSYEIPSKFNLDEEEYFKLAENLYNLIKELRNEFQKAGEILWTNLTIKVENFHFLVEYHYDNWSGREEEHHLIWGYKNLKIPLETYSKKERQIILDYLRQEKMIKTMRQTYSEPMYRNPIKNVVQYNREIPEFVKQEESDSIKQDLEHDEENPKQDIELKLEDQVEQQIHAVKSQILNRN